MIANITARSRRTLAVAALGSLLTFACVATNAKATEMVTPVKSHWYSGIGHVILAVAKTVTLHVKAGKHIDIQASPSGTSIKIDIGAAEAVGATIQNTESGAMAEWSGKLKFTGATVLEPAGCKTPTAIETTALTGRVKMKKGSASEAFVEFSPTSGETIANIALESCALAGKYALKGEMASKMGNNTGVSAVEQPLVFGSAEANEVSALKFGTSAATITGEVEMALASGEIYGVSE
jgi:hypothetical protein